MPKSKFYANRLERTTNKLSLHSINFREFKQKNPLRSFGFMRLIFNFKYLDFFKPFLNNRF